MNDQERFWTSVYAADYARKNASFDRDLGIEAWKKMLHAAPGIETILECGSNIGGNIGILEDVLPAARKSIIEISPAAFDIVTKNHTLEYAFNGSILDSNLPQGAFDLVFTRGVLIHIHPDHVVENVRKMVAYSRKYVLVAEYFNRTPVMIEYQQQKDRLFKRDFGKLLLGIAGLTLVDYGFLWGQIYDRAGFDDITWWLFGKDCAEISG